MIKNKTILFGTVRHSDIEIVLKTGQVRLYLDKEGRVWLLILIFETFMTFFVGFLLRLTTDLFPLLPNHGFLIFSPFVLVSPSRRLYGDGYVLPLGLRSKGLGVGYRLGSGPSTRSLFVVIMFVKESDNRKIEPTKRNLYEMLPYNKIRHLVTERYGTTKTFEISINLYEKSNVSNRLNYTRVDCPLPAKLDLGCRVVCGHPLLLFLFCRTLTGLSLGNGYPLVVNFIFPK